MAFNFFPTSVEELLIKTDGNPVEANIDELISLFNFLVDKNPTPIGLDLDRSDNKNKVKIKPNLENQYTMSQIKSKAKLNKLKPTFGNGSSGNRGVNNRGLGFEDVFATALEKWNMGDTVSNKYVLGAIEDLDKTYKIRDAETFLVSAEGGANTPRPLVFTPHIMLTNPKGRGNDVGKSVTDITITLDKRKRTEQEIYISAKYAKTTTFFNTGIAKILTTAEIQSGRITNPDGLRLLNLFGINQGTFCAIFNREKGSSVGSEIDRTPNVNRAGITKLLQSGIGYGYHIIHEFPGKIISKKMDKRAMGTAAAFSGDIAVFYGGKGGRGKRIDITFSSGSYNFQINIRDSSGQKNGYPSHIFGQFS